MIDKTASFKYNLEYKKGNNAILLGNGINNLEKNYRWDQLLKKIDSKINLDEKPYPLAFEEIVLNKLNSAKSKNKYNEVLKGIKNEIADHCRTIKPNSYYKKLVDINVKSFLTTNYDYAIEQTLNPQFNVMNVQRTNRDFKYSLNRFHKLSPNGVVWHIHGEIDNGYKKENPNQYSSASIMIGHEHYGDYYRRIHQYLRPFATDEETKLKIKENPNWVDFFFTHNLHIIGFSLDSSEFHIWWLLAYRARLHKIFENIDNSIYFHCASYDLNNAKYQAKIDLLKSLGVKIKMKEISEQDKSKRYPAYWDNFFKDIDQIILKNE